MLMEKKIKYKQKNLHLIVLKHTSQLHSNKKWAMIDITLNSNFKYSIQI